MQEGEHEDLKAELAATRSELAECRARLAACEKEMERFVYTVSHDLRSPLITIRGFLGLLVKDARAGDAERVQRDVDRIEGAVDKMNQLLAELLELSRIGRNSHPLQDIALADLAHEALSSLAEPIAERGVVVDVAEDLPRIRGERSRLLQVMMILIDNAVKFMGGQEQPRVEIGARSDGEAPVVYVRDNGQGIDPQHHEAIFGLFERRSSHSDGNGVGLALAKRILDVHCGRIWVESEGEGHGSTFCWTLPLASAAEPAQ